MRVKIHSKKLGRDFCFWAPDEGGHARREGSGPDSLGALGQQITRRGGAAITCPDQASLEREARRWVREYERQLGPYAKG